jgi:hypothetical protein
MVHTDYTNLTDRIARQLVKAALAHFVPSELMLDRAGRVVGAVLHASIERLARQVAKQGLLPEDFDRLEGHEALQAIAATIPQKKTATVTSFLPVPVEWKHVVDAAKRQIDLQVRHAQR